MRAALPVLIRGTVLWLAVLLVFLAASHTVLRLQNPEVSAFLTPGPPGALKTIEDRVLREYRDQQRFFDEVAVASSLVISQVALVVGTLRKRS